MTDATTPAPAAPEAAPEAIPDSLVTDVQEVVSGSQVTLLHKDGSFWIKAQNAHGGVFYHFRKFTSREDAVALARKVRKFVDDFGVLDYKCWRFIGKASDLATKESK